MIASIKGEIKEKDEGSLVIEIGGIGFRVFAPQRVCSASSLGDHISLFTYLVVREDNLSLFGFEDQEERELFQQLIKVWYRSKNCPCHPFHVSVEKIYRLLKKTSALIRSWDWSKLQKLVLLLKDRLKETGERISPVFETLIWNCWMP
jgi:Holliday junction DNA helicase RuvA